MNSTNLKMKLAQAMVGLTVAGVVFVAWGKQTEPLATDLIGPVYSISEEDALKAIESKLKQMEASGELEKLGNKIKNDIEGKILEPEPIPGITTVEKEATRYFDPTWTLNEDLFDDDGNVMASKGTKVNPLEVMPITKKLFFFDGRDAEQVKMAKQLANKFGHEFTPILTAGSWLDLSNEMQQAVYFDQGGKMTTRLTVTSVPSLVFQENKMMRIEEMKP